MKTVIIYILMIFDYVHDFRPYSIKSGGFAPCISLPLSLYCYCKAICVLIVTVANMLVVLYITFHTRSITLKRFLFFQRFFKVNF